MDVPCHSTSSNGDISLVAVPKVFDVRPMSECPSERKGLLTAIACSEVLAQEGNASRAAATACSTSFAPCRHSVLAQKARTLGCSEGPPPAGTRAQTCIVGVELPTPKRPSRSPCRCSNRSHRKTSLARQIDSTWQSSECHVNTSARLFLDTSRHATAQICQQTQAVPNPGRFSEYTQDGASIADR